jgi:hypothetical protein
MNAADELDVLFSSFEDFVTDRESFIDRYIRFYGAPIEAFSWEDATTQHEGTDFHFRKGLREEWREVFSPQEARHLTSYMPMAMRERFGWPD